MKSLFDEAVLKDVMDRICAMEPKAERQWGKMDPAQMMAHCSATLAMAAGQTRLPRLFLGRILGPMVKPVFVGEREFRKNGPTAREFIVADTRVFNTEKERLLQLVHAFGAGGATQCTTHPHPFFGRLTPSEWGIVMFKHLDHHLRQFGG